MPPSLLIPTDDLYARLELPPDASFEAIELAWRALLRRHHPDVAGVDGLELAKRINVAHDWLSDPVLRRRYDRERLPGGGRGGRVGPGMRRGDWATDGGRAPAPRPVVRRRAPEDPAAALRRFLERVSRLSADELDRLDCAEPAPIAFVATIRRFLAPEPLSAVAEVEEAVRERLPATSWSHPAVREAVLGYAHELVLAPSLDELLTEPFRSRVRERLTRGWQAAVGQPRYGPNGPAVEALIARLERLTLEERRALAATGSLERLGDAPWPAGTSVEDDEALRVSSVLAGRDASAVVAGDGLDRAALGRARRAAARVAHLLVLRHAFGPREFAALTAPWRPLLVEAGRPPARPVRRR